MDIKIRVVTLEIRTTRLTRALLRQMRHVDMAGLAKLQKASPKDSGIIGWFSGGIISDGDCLLLTDGEDYFVHQYVPPELKEKYKQIYIEK